MASTSSALAAEKKKRPARTSPRHLTSIMETPAPSSGTQKCLRLQNKSPVSPIPESRLAQPSLTPPVQISQLASTKWKGLRDSEAEIDEPKGGRSAKQPLSCTNPSLEPSEVKLPKDPEAGAKDDGPKGLSEQPQEPPLLSDEDSQLLQSLYKDVMDFTPNTALAQPSPRRSMVQSETVSERTRGTSNTNAVYRHQNLHAVKIHLHADPPGYIETAIEAIVDAQLSEKARAELEDLAKKFHHNCLEKARGQFSENDWLSPLFKAIEGLHVKDLCLLQDSAWRSELKPVVPQGPHFSSSFMVGVQQHTNEHISPELPMTNASAPSINDLEESSMMPPPALIPKKAPPPLLKNPNPDLAMGINFEALISALSSQGLVTYKARAFMEWLQKEMVQLKPDGPPEPMLILAPAGPDRNLAFPFAVVEGKAYSTGKQIFEAENQAAGAMACAHNILHSLDRIANHGTTTNTEPCVLFSITTQGPIHELWAYWTVIEDGVRMFESKLWDSWNVLVLKQAVDFIVKLNNVCVWGTGPFMKFVVERLGKVAVQAQT